MNSNIKEVRDALLKYKEATEELRDVLSNNKVLGNDVAASTKTSVSMLHLGLVTSEKFDNIVTQLDKSIARSENQ